MAVHKLSERERVRNNRVARVRKYVEKGWNMKQLLHFCEMTLGVGRVTAVSYIDEAAKKHREKYQKEQQELKNEN